MKQLFEIVKFNPKIDSLDRLTNKLNHVYKINQEFFGKGVGKIDYYVVYSREEMNELTGRQTADWMRGNGDDDRIAVISESKTEEVTKGIHTAASFNNLLVHETAHLFVQRLFKLECPRWLDEGIAGYVAEQGKKDGDVLNYDIPEFSQLHTSEQWNKQGDYPAAFSITRYIINQFGKDKLFYFLNSLKEENSFEAFSNKFKEGIGISFEEVKKDWWDDLRKRHSKEI